MKYGEFKIIIKQNISFEKRYNYISDISLLLVSIAVIVVLRQPGIGNKFLDYLLVPAMAIVFLNSLFSLLLLPKKYRIKEIYSSLSTIEKSCLLSRVLPAYVETMQIQEENYLKYYFKKKWWGSPGILHLYYDDHKYAFIMIDEDMGSGWVDEAFTERLKIKLSAQIKKSEIEVSSLGAAGL